ncbi:hypothetical protein BT67DRAFT_452735 [Trichocladium antarcticum]|uniref:Nuclear segregation protein n=1 Tax=Trichocladium antarcticum TaxID=1450529 RepID=A0AAN6UBJ5_9PEZI|nr:hypothetical protein BT67DRAFT_452735 [Trichocladium antarcticum]
MASSDSNTPAAAAPAAASASASAAPAVTRPTQPDQKVFQEGVDKLQKEHQIALDQFKAIRAKIDLASPDKSRESPTQQRRAELIRQANEIRQKQGVGKNARSAKMDQVKRLDEQMRSRIAEQKTARAKVPFKSVEEVDQKIDRLDRDVNTGTMKLVDEKKALAEISSLRKLRKNFSQFDDSQKAIDHLKAKIKDIKDSMEDPEAKALSERYNKIQAELDAIKAQQDEAYNNLSSLRKERSQLHARQEETYQALRKFRDEYHAQRKAFVEWDKEQKQKRREREQAERERHNKERKMERAQKMLAEAGDLAYLEEMRRANSLVHFFDPTHPVAEKAPLLADKGLAAAAQRTVDDSAPKGVKLMRKEDRDDEYLPAVKKGKKGKKSHAAPADGAAAPAGPASSSSKFSCPPSVIEDCAFVGVEPPMSAAEVPAALEKIKAKLDHWKADQPEQTRRNIEKAKKEISRIEAEEAAAGGGSPSGASTPADGVDGKKEVSEDKAVAEATEAVEKVALEQQQQQQQEEEEKKVAEDAVAAPAAQQAVEAAA